jgi:hypothetical protein
MNNKKRPDREGLSEAIGNPTAEVFKTKPARYCGPTRQRASFVDADVSRRNALTARCPLCRRVNILQRVPA